MGGQTAKTPFTSFTLAAIEAAKKGADDKKSEEKDGVIEKTTKP